MYYRFFRYLSKYNEKIIFGKIIAKFGSNESFSIIILKLIYQFGSVLSSIEIVEGMFIATVIGSEI